MKKVKADSCSFVPSPTSAHEPHMIIACVWVKGWCTRERCSIVGENVKMYIDMYSTRACSVDCINLHFCILQIIVCFCHLASKQICNGQGFTVLLQRNISTINTFHHHD
jgi:hypothetical protein